MKYTPKALPEENVNVTNVHPLVNFGYLVGTVVAFSAAIYISLGFVASQLVGRMGPDLEAKIGQYLAPEAETADNPRLQYLTRLLADLSETEPRIPLTLHLIESDQPNAAVTPGGHIWVTTGLLEQAESENEVAFVLAHELGHFQAKDALRGLGRSLVFVAIASVLGLGNSSGADLVPVVGQFTSLQYSRQQETAADEYALARIVEHYGHGGSSLDFFKRIQDQEFDLGGLSTVSEYFSTHPITADRVAELEALAAEQNWPLQGEATPLPESIHSDS